jgi:hypothetical protein
MKQKIFFVLAAFAVALLFAFRHAEITKSKGLEFYATASRKTNLVRCTPDWNLLKEWMEENDIPPLPGAGDYKWKISTGSDSAQFYFNQGINTYYSFHIIESMASFKKATRFDPTCAILYWAQALALWPEHK